jgi:Microsomal signal peptidase 25 kDa subunit (SPC25)
MDGQTADGAQKVPLYSINGERLHHRTSFQRLISWIDLKNATDDALAPYLTTLPSPYTFRQSHYYANIRLLVGYSAVAIAAATFYLDWKLGWDATKNYTAGACLLYFTLNGFLTLWIWRSEAGRVFVGLRDGQQKVGLGPDLADVPMLIEIFS